MKYYKDLNNELYVDPILENHVGLIEIQEDEFKELVELKLKPTPEQLLVQQISEAKQYLANTGWYIERLNDPSSGKAVPEEVLVKRAEARELINTLEVQLGGN